MGKSGVNPAQCRYCVGRKAEARLPSACRSRLLRSMAGASKVAASVPRGPMRVRVSRTAGLNFAINGEGRRVQGMMAKIQEKIDAGEDATSVDLVSGATWSSKSIVEAYKAAIASAPVEIASE